MAVEKPVRPSGPLTITSKNMTVKNLEHTAIFDGGVVMTQGDMTITADHAVVTFHSGKGLPSPSSTAGGFLLQGSAVNGGRISLIHISGHVELRQVDKRASSHEAFYYHAEDRVVLEGDPVIWEKDYQVTGSRMTLFIRENRSIVEGSKVMIHSNGEEK